jgi:hypothetical protein
MKRALIATILGLAASVASSYGQANYVFNTYGPSAGAPAGVVTWSSVASLAPAGEAGLGVTTADAVKANLLWQVGATTGDLGLAVPTTTDGGFDGWIEYGPVVGVDGAYTGGPITFTIEVWQGNSFLTAAYRGTETWTEAGPSGPALPAIQFANLPQVPITISAVPEPTTLALAGLSAAGLLMFRKRQ